MPTNPEIEADVCMLLEGTYPYVQGGVSSWVHQIITEMPDTSFALFFIGSKRELLTQRFYELPPNVVSLRETYIFETPSKQEQTAGRPPKALRRRIYECLEGIYEGENIDARVAAFFQLVERLDEAGDAMRFGNLSQDYEAWLILKKVYQKWAADESFLDFFWSTRFMHMPVWALLQERRNVPKAKVYHTISTGYAGLMGALAARYANRPLLLTEHGIYTKERIAEISQATWIREKDRGYFDLKGGLGIFKDMWIQLFAFYGHVTYLASDKIIALFEGNNKLQTEYGAPAERLDVIPNGIDPSRFVEARERRRQRRAAARDAPFVVGFLGRVVPIKDVKTLIRAAYNVVRKHPQTQFLLAGPTDEEPDYFRECEEMARLFHLETAVQFVGRQNIVDFLPTIDAMVLTSISEGLPLVIIEAFCVGVPVVSTDVGACRELIFGRAPEDKALGRAGMLTKISSPDDTAAALGELAANPDLVDQMGASGFERVQRHYVQADIIGTYLDLYQNTSWSARGAAAPSPN